MHPVLARFLTAVLTSAALLLSGCAASSSPSADLIDLFGAADAIDLVTSPRSAESTAYRIDGMAGWSKEAGDDRPRVHAFPVISGPVPVDDASLATLSDVLSDDDTYLWDIAKACEFLPGVAFRYAADGLTVDVLICFSCDELEVYRNGAKVGHEDFDPRRADLVRVAKSLFPDDEKIQSLK